jgi:deoxyribodipyrimidine photolyase-related protein
MIETAQYYRTKNLPMQVQPETFSEALFILHDQLNLAVFPAEILAKKPLLIFVESLAYATAIPHHKQKLVYILSAQRHFAEECFGSGFAVLNLWTEGTHAQALGEFLRTYPTIQLTYMLPSEWDTRQAIADLVIQFPQRVQSIPNQFFLADLNQFQSKIRKGYRLETFYREMRKITGFLIDNGKPVGGKWNFDQDNRKSLPKGVSIPAIAVFPPDPITTAVIQEITEFFPNHFGEITKFGLAVTRSQALSLAAQFMSERLDSFGTYEDAMQAKEPFLFHSVLSIYLNNGLLLPRELCEMAIAAYENGQARLNSVEGFVRQILGWREFIRVYYEAQMPSVRSANHFKFELNLPQMYWDGKTDLACMQDAIANVIDNAYTHHIQRLMVLSNFSNLTLTNPLQLNQWFWFAYADAYEWVELPNVLGMATFADGGILASKPYVSSGNYINKMSNYCRNCQYDVKQKTGAKACPFNYLYWNFVDAYRQDFNENGRISVMTGMFDRKSESEQQEIKDSAQEFITNLPRS